MRHPRAEGSWHSTGQCAPALRPMLPQCAAEARLVVCEHRFLGYLVRMELHAAAANLREVREWDFLCFWLWGRAGARGANFYDPAASAWMAEGLELSPEFQRQIVDVGFWYPPPTMLLFAPFGALPVRAALLLWYALQWFWLGTSAIAP